MGFNIGSLGAAFQGQQDYEQYMAAKKMRDMQLAQMQAQNDPKSQEMAWNTMLQERQQQDDAQKLAMQAMQQQGQQPVPPMPGQASMPSGPPRQPMPQQGPQMPQGGPQPNGPMPQQGMGAPPPQAPPIPPYRPMPTGGQPPGQAQGQPPAQPGPQAAPQGMSAPGQPGQEQQAPSGPPVELKHNMTLQDAQRFIQQHYGDATPVQKFQALEKVHSYLSADAKIEFQQKALDAKIGYENALVKIKEQVATTDEGYKKQKGELLEAQAELTKVKKLSEELAIRLNLAERKVATGEKNADANTIKAEALKKRAASAASSVANGGTLSPEELEYWTEIGKKTPALIATLFPRGKAGSAARDQIAKNMSKGGAAGADATISERSNVISEQKSLDKLVPQYDAIKAFEKTAISNGDRLIALADKVDTTGVPVLEQWIRGGRKATGSVDVDKFNAQMMLYRTEAAKILVNPNLTGQLSDSARHEVEEFLKGNMSAKSIRGVVELLKNDFQSREKILADQIKEAKHSQVKGFGSADIPVYSDKAGLDAAIKAGKIKKGDTFNDPSGNSHVVN